MREGQFVTFRFSRCRTELFQADTPEQLTRGRVSTQHGGIVEQVQEQDHTYTPPYPSLYNCNFWQACVELQPALVPSPAAPGQSPRGCPCNRRLALLT